MDPEYRYCSAFSLLLKVDSQEFLSTYSLLRKKLIVKLYIVPVVVLMKMIQKRFAHETIIKIHTSATTETWPVNVLFNISFV